MVGVCLLGQLLRGSWSLAGCFVRRDRQHYSPWRVALWLHWRGHSHRHTARRQTLLFVSHFHNYHCMFVYLFLLECIWIALKYKSILFFPLRWATTTATSSSSASIDSRTYDEVYESVAVKRHHFAFVMLIADLISDYMQMVPVFSQMFTVLLKNATLFFVFFTMKPVTFSAHILPPTVCLGIAETHCEFMQTCPAKWTQNVHCSKWTLQ